jgi:TniQ
MNNTISLRLRSDPANWQKPICTRFFALAPCGVGTALQESLPSYLDRLARLHSVPNGSFFLNEVHPKPVPSSGSLLGEHSRSMLLGNNYSERIASFVARSTGVPEVAGLGQPILSRCLGWFKNTQPKAGWCPLCFADWANQGLPIYRPLLWSLAPVRCCPVHNVLLQEQCPGCSRRLDHFASRGWPSFCPDCGRALSEYDNSSGATDHKVPSSYDEFSASHLSDLLKWGTTCSPGDLPDGCFTMNIRNAIEVFGGEHALARFTGLSRGIIKSWRHGGTRPQLPGLLSLSYCFHVPLHHWVSQLVPHGTFVSGTVAPNDVSSFKTDLLRPPRHLIEQAILAALAQQTDDPPSVAKLANAINIGHRYLYVHFPHLTRQVVERRANAVARRKEHNAQERVRIVRETIAEFQASGRRLSRYAVCIRLRERGVRCIWLLRGIVQREFQLLASDPPNGSPP